MTTEERGVPGSVRIFPLPGLPVVEAGDDIASLVARVAKGTTAIASGDVVVVTSKIVSRAEGRFVDLSTVAVSERAAALAIEVDKDPRLVEVILGETTLVSRAARGALIVKNRLGIVSANAGVDRSNAVPGGAPSEGGAVRGGPWVTLLPLDPDASARRLGEGLRRELAVDVAVIVTDSVGRPFRLGSTGIAIGVSGITPLVDQTGRPDLFGRALEHTATALADQIATAADLVAGQAAEGHGVVVVRGIRFETSDTARAERLLRDADTDLYVGRREP